MSFMKRKKLAVLPFLYLLSANSIAATDIGAPSSGFFAKMGAWMQELVNFLEGPWGLFVPIAGLSIAIAVWMFSTKGNESLGWVGRVVIGALMIINIPSLVIAIKAF